MINSNKLTLIIAWLIHVALSVQNANSELYTSADELSKWFQVTSNISGIIQNMIEDHEIRLKQLRRLQNSIKPLVEATGSNSSDNKVPNEENKLFRSDELMKNPVNAFVIINRLQRAIEGVEDLFSSEKYIYSDDQTRIDDPDDISSQLVPSQFLDKLRGELPFEADLLGSARALLRLQAFYDLKLRQLMNGIIESNSTTTQSRGHLNELAGEEVGPLQMNVWDCFELGRIAFREDLFGLAIQWLVKTLEMIYDEETNECDHEESESMINDILDYMSFSAYKLGMVPYSAELTRAWLDRDPENERAKENLDYYLELLDQEQEQQQEKEEDKREPINEAERFDGQDVSSYPYLRDGIDKYSPVEDRMVRNLCGDFEKFEHASSSMRELKCELRSNSLLTPEGHFSPGDIKIELLSDEPRVVRLYDIITEKEANHLREAARPILERSTVNSGNGLKTSDFRIAKTAWLSGARDELVRRVERRLEAALNLNMESSEQLQVVNYGLGGFYGPHLDSARKFEPDDESVMVSELHQNDRLATILIYLSQVDAGGATVFPRLNLTVAPIERSAVAWFNILPNGHSDKRTLHTGCPVLLGFKWIATKWPRERANAFTRPCRLTDGAPRRQLDTDTERS